MRPAPHSLIPAPPPPPKQSNIDLDGEAQRNIEANSNVAALGASKGDELAALLLHEVLAVALLADGGEGVVGQDVGRELPGLWIVAYREAGGVLASLCVLEDVVWISVGY